MLEIHDLTRTYANGVAALQGVTVSIPRGLFGLLGPNGAGKSTLMRTLATLQLPDRGSESAPVNSKNKVNKAPVFRGETPSPSALKPHLDRSTSGLP